MKKILCFTITIFFSVGISHAQQTIPKRSTPEVKKTDDETSRSYAGDYSTLRLVRTIKLPLKTKGEQPWARVVVFSPDNKTIACGLDYITPFHLILWDVETGEMKRSMTPDNRGNSDSSVRAIAYSPDGNTIATADGFVRLWNATTGRFLKTLASDTSVTGVAFSPDGKIVAGGGTGTADEDPSGAVYLWDLQTGKLIRKMTNLNSDVSSIAFSPNGNILAGASSNVWLWSTKNLSLLRNLKRNNNHNHGSVIAFAPNGKIIVSAGAIGDDEKRSEIRFWSVATGSLLRSFVDYDRDIYSLTFSPDGNILASCGADRTVKLWNVQTAKLLKTLIKIETKEDGYAFLTAAFSPDGKMLAAGNQDGIIRVWKITE